MKKRGKLRQLFRNLKYLAKTDLRAEFDERLKQAEDNYRYMLRNEDLIIPRPKILNSEDTVRLLLDKPKSFSRFGDGELNIMTGRGAAAQRENPRLAEYLWEIVKNNNENMYVGICYTYFHANENAPEFIQDFMRRNTYRYRKLLLSVCNMDQIYIDAAFNQVYMNTVGLDYDSYYSNVKKLFKNKKIVLFAGKGVLHELEYDIFDEVAERIDVEGPAVNAFNHLDEILEKAKTFSKDYTLCFILGPTSKVLCYELSKLGYMAWDLGHLAEDYNAYRKKLGKAEDDSRKFFNPK